VVKNLTDYGAFVDLGGIDGLLHITDMAWKRVKHPSEVVNVGDEIEVRILKFDRERQRVSLGSSSSAPTRGRTSRAAIRPGTRLFGKVTNIADYGCFVEIEEGVEGLVHVSEMDWTNKNVNPSKVVHIGEEVEVMVLDIDEDRRRISLGIKQCKPNPWREFADNYNRGDRVSGQIRSITDFGLFHRPAGRHRRPRAPVRPLLGRPGEEAVRGYQKGQTVEAIVVAIDPERERISLSVKQLAKDPFSTWIARAPEGHHRARLVKDVDAKGAMVDLGGGIEGYLRASELSRDRVEDARTCSRSGDEIEASFMAVDRKVRTIALSIKAKECAEEPRRCRTTAPTPRPAPASAISSRSRSPASRLAIDGGPRRQDAAAGLTERK
jgi:small subunit ribosomal protein S1